MGWNSRNNQTPEKEIESYLVSRITDLGGMCPKWTSPGTKSVPDRIVFMPEGLVVFVELKRERGGRISPMQKWREKQLSSLGQKVFFIHTREQVDMLVSDLMKGQIPNEL